MNISYFNVTDMPERPVSFNSTMVSKRYAAFVNLDIKEESDGTFSCISLHIISDIKLSFEEVLKAVDGYGYWDYVDEHTVKAMASHFFGHALYEDITPRLIGVRYSVNDELSCHRKALLGDDKPLRELNEYVSYCKELAAKACAF